jgi:preprotein translocase subunit YajC
MLIFFGLMLAVMYFVMILPQQRQVKQHKALLAALRKGDEVVTQGGMVGKVFLVGDKRITVEVANGVRIQVLKSSIQTVSTPEKAAAAEAEEQKEKS